MKPINEQISPIFVNQARVLAKYTDLLRKILPAECLNHVEVANIRNQSLMLITDSPVWTTKLRQLSPQILQALTEQSLPVTSATEKPLKIHHVQISTRYKHSHDNTASAVGAKSHSIPAPTISGKTAQLLSQSADSIDHPQLKTALLKLASHASPNTTDKQKKDPDF